ncbi:MAG: hypothetical protein JXR59_00425 [Desulfuromonadaceae bacterium]|nr:hypothetical protein [Desulfuromonadaceae bacterium]
MKTSFVLVLTVVVLVILSVPSFVFADDLDDGISKFTDDGVSKWDEIGKNDRNVKFTILKAKSAAAVRSKNGTNTSAQGTDSTGAINSVLLGPGGTVRGDIIIIDESRGDKTQVVE